MTDITEELDRIAREKAVIERAKSKLKTVRTEKEAFELWREFRREMAGQDGNT